MILFPWCDQEVRAEEEKEDGQAEDEGSCPWVAGIYHLLHARQQTRFLQAVPQ